MSTVIERHVEGRLAKRLPVVYDNVFCTRGEMNFGEGIMYSIMRNPIVRMGYFFKDLILEFARIEHRHKDYIAGLR